MSMKRGHGVDTAEGLDAWVGQSRQGGAVTHQGAVSPQVGRGPDICIHETCPPLRIVLVGSDMTALVSPGPAQAMQIGKEHS